MRENMYISHILWSSRLQSVDIRGQQTGYIVCKVPMNSRDRCLSSCTIWASAWRLIAHIRGMSRVTETHMPAWTYFLCYFSLRLLLWEDQSALRTLRTCGQVEWLTHNICDGYMEIFLLLDSAKDVQSWWNNLPPCSQCWPCISRSNVHSPSS